MVKFSPLASSTPPSTRAGVAQRLKSLVADPPQRRFHLGRQRQLAHARRDGLAGSLVPSVGHDCGAARGSDLVLVFDHALSQYQWRDVGQRPGGEHLRQSPVELRRNQIKLNAHHAAGRSQLIHDLGNAGKSLHRFDTGDIGLLPGVGEAAPDEENCTARENEQGCRTHGAGVVEYIAVMEQERGVHPRLGHTSAECNQPLVHFVFH